MRSDVVPIRRGLPRTILVALLLRRGQTVPSDFLVDLLWGDELPRNPANALQIQVSYLRKTLGGAEPDGSDAAGDAGRWLRAAGRAGADRCPSVRGRASQAFAPLTSLAFRGGAAPGAGRGRARAGAVAGRRARGRRRHGLRPWRDRPARRAAVGGDGTPDRPAAAARPPRRRDRRPVRAGPADAVARAVPRATRARPVPVGPPGRRLARLRAMPAGRWSRSSGSIPARSCATWNDGSSSRTRPWTGRHPTSRHAAPADRARRAGAPPRRRTSGRLPVPVSPLIGRDAAARPARAPSGTATGRVTLTGPAGAGKTRLAIEVAGRATGDRSCYVDFSPIDDPGLVAADGRRRRRRDDHTGRRPGGGDRRRRWRPANVLLVLDTCEHVVGRSRPAGVGRACTPRPACASWPRAGARSASPASSPGRCRRWTCPRRTPPPPAEITSHAAVALFIERATAVRPDLDDRRRRRRRHRRGLHRARRPAAGHRAGRRPHRRAQPGGHPLAAARTASSCSSTAASTSPSGSRRCAPPIDWSFELLSADQRTFFARLGVFAGTFDLDAALTVAGDGLDAPLELLASLVKQSMVARAGHDRYRLLDTLARLRARGPRRPRRRRDPRPPRRRTTCSWPSRARSRSAAPTSSPGSTGSAATSTTSAPRSSGACSPATPPAPPAWPARWRGSGRSTACSPKRSSTSNGWSRSTTCRRRSAAKCLWGYALLAASLGRLETARDAGYRAAELGRPCDDRRHRVRPQRRRRRRVGARQPRAIARRPPRGDRAARQARRPLGTGRVQRAPGPHPVRPRRRHGGRRSPDGRRPRTPRR